MKKYLNIWLCLIVISVILTGFGPTNNYPNKYNRSSLHLFLIESESFPQKDYVMKSWDNYPFPDKYDSHKIDDMVFNPKDYPLTDEELSAAGYSTSNTMGSFGKDLTAGIIDPENESMQLRIDKYVQDHKIANKLVAKWFNVSDSNEFDMNLIQERGVYNATELEASVANASVRGSSMLADAGEQLIQNTFVVFSKLTYVSNEPVAYIAYEVALNEAEKIRIARLRDVAKTAAEVAYNKAKEGYSVWTYSWLYKLKWNDEIAAIFYETMWNDSQELMNSDLFELEFVGRESSRSLVTFSLSESRSEEQIIDIATVRNVDNTFAKLQKEYDVFKPVVPITNINPIRAHIGTKEGLEGGEKFDVYEMILNPDTGVTEMMRVATITSDENNIWDNRYNAGETPQQLDEVGTQFKGPGNNIRIGMLIKQVK
jgi:hypothetical protein